MTIGLGPYQVDTYYDNGEIKIRTIDEDNIPFLVNGHRLRVYRKPLIKEDFIQQFQRQYINLIGGFEVPNIV